MQTSNWAIILMYSNPHNMDSSLIRTLVLGLGLLVFSSINPGPSQIGNLKNWEQNEFKSAVKLGSLYY